MKESDFIRHYASNAEQIMWFLGAGTSRSAGMPTANDIIWDLKLRYYCLQENQDIQQHDISNNVVRKKIQSYLDSKGFPEAWSNEEYSFYFELSFADDYSAQQKYLSEQLSNDKISLNVGHRALAGLIALNRARLLFTTNFDEVIETAYSKVIQKHLPTYHLEGAYGALDALNSERYPIYSKVHGDFKYQSIKNLAIDLLENDQKIQDCFLAACSRYGLIITGYSGRDQNVMNMFRKAIEQHNAFPAGIFWTVLRLSDAHPNVIKFIQDAKDKGINANLVESGTFDTMLSKIWRQVKKPDELDAKVRTVKQIEVSIPLPDPGKSFPVIRTNALPIVQVENTLAKIDSAIPLSYPELKDLVRSKQPKAIMAKGEFIMGWGSKDEFIQTLGYENCDKIVPYILSNPVQSISQSTILFSIYERAIWTALAKNKPIRKRSNRGFYLCADHTQNSDPRLATLKKAVGYRGSLGSINGRVPNSDNVFWSEAVKVKTEIKNGSYWLLLEPTIWIEPFTERHNFRDFIKSKRGKRYNQITSSILDAWITILLGSTGDKNVEIGYYEDTEFPLKFEINSRTAYSRK